LKLMLLFFWLSISKIVKGGVDFLQETSKEIKIIKEIFCIYFNFACNMQNKIENKK